MTMASAVLTVLAAVVVARGRGAVVGVAAVVAAAVSVAVTAVERSPGGSPPTWGPALVPLLAEFSALTMMVVRVTHRAPPRVAVPAAGAAGSALALLVLRLTGPPSWLAVVGACGLWGLTAVGAVLVGLYLRREDQRREQAAAGARRAQRQGLARDLHDYVAHDVSEMLAAAQAGLVVGGDPDTAASLFRRIEQAGQHALAALDRTVHMLGERPPRLDDLPALVAGFDAAGPVRAGLSLDPLPAESVPDDVSALAYRTVAEALTNVRRHAPAATAVRVAVTRTAADTLTVTVSNDLPVAPAAPARGTTGGRGLPGLAAAGGRGLPGLAAAAAAVGGRVDAGLHGDRWRLRAVLPLAHGKGPR
ncbi:sensor histidine kinase [Catenuloplanes atrovinosus]|uniref:histidine kinase n=1 Tax=Catenuloplanes atrovinosus TaxID=137266 RepID=A0AAE3YR49_9ACTN|nr:histidine kinase [Catenuloplanes atrovinosus]MDR7277165.1 signal transduction histidine kinase [Catenuloplanes atrovinosus]